MTTAFSSAADRMQGSTRGARSLLRTAASVESASLGLRPLLQSPILRTLADPLATLLAGAPALEALDDALGRLQALSEQAVRRDARPGASAPGPTRMERPAGTVDRPHGAGPRTAGIPDRGNGLHAMTAALAEISGNSALRTMAAALAEVDGWRSSSQSSATSQPRGRRSGARTEAAVAGVAHQQSARRGSATDALPAPSTLPSLTTADLAAAAGLRSDSGPSARSGTPGADAPRLPATSPAPRVPIEAQQKAPPEPRAAESRPVPEDRLPPAHLVAPTPVAGGALGELVTRWQQDAGSGVPASAPAPDSVPVTVDQVERAVDAMLRREAEQHGLTGVDQ